MLSQFKINENAVRDIRACDVTYGNVYKRRDAPDRRRPVLIMQEDPGHRKRKADEVPSSIFGTSRIRRSKIEAVEAELQWPDYFIEVSAREGSSKLTLGTSFVSVVQGMSES